MLELMLGILSFWRSWVMDISVGYGMEHVRSGLGHYFPTK